MVKHNLFSNPNIKVLQQMGNIKVLEHQKDLSVSPADAASKYFMKEMNLKKRQVIIELNNESCILSPGKMQWIAGDVSVRTGVKGVGDFFKKAVSGAVTNEGAIKPEYFGTGCVMLEPSYKYLIIVDVGQWPGGMVLDDGIFEMCQGTVEQAVTARSNLSSAILGREGLFNLTLSGQGLAVLESTAPVEELVEFDIVNDEVKIDGNYAIAWSKSLEFTVEKTTKTLVGSAASGEGFVNVYRGTGKLLMAIDKWNPQLPSKA